MTRCPGFIARLAAICAVLVLAGCAPDTDAAARQQGIGTARAATATGVAPRLDDDLFIAADGVSLPLKVWLPPGAEPKAVILALHGFNDYRNAFAIPAKLWAENGIATYAYDQRGFGASPDRTLWPGRAPLAADAATAARLLRQRYPGIPLYLLGESMGGAVAIIAETGESGTPRPDVDGVILGAPAVWGYETMNLPERIGLWAMVRLFPSATFTGNQLRIVACDNNAVLRAMARDPLIIKATRVDAVYGLVNLMTAALDAAPKLRTPLLLQYGAHDQIIPPDPVRLFVGGLPAVRDTSPGTTPRLAYYPHGYHMLYRDLDGATVARDVASWVLDRTAPLPSREDAAENARPWPPTQSSTPAPTPAHSG
ncbi:MAG TPA: alpha/beta fold hydrolase [Stellaceae bacterium]|jgi:alpha-beta hydrolase superfamily lysophospholipase|nr:alpha/beta fold hydrolase [Stellaceae bacterium]